MIPLWLACSGPAVDSGVPQADADTDADADSDTDADADTDSDADTDAPLLTDYAWSHHLGVGELDDPRAVALRGTELVVADTANARLAVYSLDGVLTDELGVGTLTSPKHVAVSDGLWTADTEDDLAYSFDPDMVFGDDLIKPYASLPIGDEIVVSDYGHDRLRVYSASGEWLRDFGDGTELDAPSGLLYGDGRLYVASTLGDRIQVYEDEVLVDTLGVGTLNDPHQMAWDPDGSLWVADQLGFQVVKLTVEGGVVTTIGSRGPEDDRFDWPFGVAIGPDREVYVADMKNDRISVWAPE
ncbi:MAG: hypothetical protein GY913_22270 [Proteobacteria bacterium]|nr:hypothetical protein [Pseudomonadota bacterium]MCP4919637.1 hypothetical protein [Pseudomonadota bacterium]